MLAYFLVYLITLLSSLLFPKLNQNNYIWKLVIVFLPLFIFGAIRVDFGRDEYDIMFEAFHSQETFAFDKDAHSELGFQLLCYILPDFRSMLVFTSALMCISFIVFFRNNIEPESLPIAISLLFLTGNVSIYFILASLRGGIAISLFLLSTTLIRDRKLVLYIIMTILAGYFHTTAYLIFPLAYIVGRTTPISRFELVFWIVFIVFFAVSSTTGLLQLITPIVNKYFSRYDQYVELGIEHGNTSHVLGTMGSAILFGFLSIISRQMQLTVRERSVVRIAMLYSIALIMTSLNVRISHFTALYIVAATSTITSKYHTSSSMKLAYLCYVFLYVGYMFYLWTKGSWFTHLVYHSLWGTM